MTTRHRLLAAVGVAGIIGVVLVARRWTRVPSLVAADRVTLISVDGRDPDRRGPPAGEALYDYPVLGRVEIADHEQRRALADALRESLGRSGIQQGKCFWPRHVLRIESGGRTTDYVICFHCQNYELFIDGQNQNKYTLPFSRHVEPAFSGPLRAAGVPIAPDE